MTPLDKLKQAAKNYAINNYSGTTESDYVMAVSENTFIAATTSQAAREYWSSDAEVWILFSIQNEYNQPDSAFERIFFNKPTINELAHALSLNSKAPELQELLDGKKYNDGSSIYWIISFKKNNYIKNF